MFGWTRSPRACSFPVRVCHFTLKVVAANFPSPSPLALLCHGCTVVAVADAAVTGVATTVKVGATVVGTTVDVVAAGMKAVAGSSDDD